MKFYDRYYFWATSASEAASNWTNVYRSYDWDVSTGSYRYVTTSDTSSYWIKGSDFEYKYNGDITRLDNEFDKISIGIFTDYVYEGSGDTYLIPVIDGIDQSPVDIISNTSDNFYYGEIDTTDALTVDFIENSLDVKMYGVADTGTQMRLVREFLVIGQIEYDSNSSPLHCYYTANSQTSTANIDWTDLSNSTDNDDDTFTTVTLGNGETSETITYSTNSNSKATTGLTISKVEVGIVIDKSIYSTFYVTPKFGGSSLGDSHTVANLSVYDDSMIDWIDITDDTNAPGTWTWSDIDNLDINMYCSRAAVPGTSEEKISGVYIRVTFLSDVDFGLEVWNSSGNKTLSYTDRISKLLYTVEVAASADGSTKLVGYGNTLTNDNSVLGFSYALEADKMPHTVEVSVEYGDVIVEWTAKSYTIANSTNIASSKSLIVVLGY